MNAIILSIGDELILGQTVDTNSAWLARQLASIGLPCAAHITLPDDQRAIESAIAESVGRCDFLLVTGGLGPTVDDLTRQALAAMLRQPLEPNETAQRTLDEFFAKLNRPMPASNQIQAMIPRGSAAIFNTCGTAAGIDAPYQSPDQKTLCRIFAMPGVPKEMKAMFARDVLPHLRSSSRGAVILSRTLHTFGLGESAVAELLGPLMHRTRNPSVGTTVSHGVVSLRLNARFPSLAEAQSQLDSTDQACRSALGPLVYGADDETLPHALAELLTRSSELGTKNLTVTTAESCTGGLLAKMLTDLPGSSTYFKQSWVTYSNEAKRDRLGVSENILNVHGAVSEPVVAAMATNARRLAKADFSLAISGIAGPTGGSAQKPVGTVCIALAHTPPNTPKSQRYAESTTVTRTFHFPGDREMIRDRSAKMAITLLRYHLLNRPLPF
jgi:nicotinamide-nucleotide amidase